ncbi:MAG TPA: TlpA disulfide reductase family protein [Nocardioides sp.]|nr:TlpA disulfide reductase family protein [Nocardioides sp.]
MRRVLLAGALGLMVGLLTACSGVHPSDFVAGKSRVKVDSPSLVAFKKNTDIPNCPKVSSTSVEDGMPDVTVPCLGGGRSVDVAGLRGPMIVNFWQSTCHPCRQEMPALAAYARGQSAVQVLGIDILDVQPAAALQLARDSLVGYPLVADPAGNLVGQKPVPRNIGLPFTAYVDASGRVVHVEAGAMTSEKDVAEAAQKYLGVGG